MGTHSRKHPSDPNLRLRIELAMLKKGLSATALATAIGRSKGTVSHWLSGRFEPPRPMITRLAHVLGVTEGWLMGENVVTEEQRARERRYLEHAIRGGERLVSLLESFDPEELIALLEAHRSGKTQPRK